MPCTQRMHAFDCLHRNVAENRLVLISTHASCEISYLIYAMKWGSTHVVVAVFCSDVSGGGEARRIGSNDTTELASNHFLREIWSDESRQVNSLSRLTRAAEPQFSHAK